MTTVDLTGTHAEKITGDAIKVMRDHFEGQHAHILTEAQAKVREAVRAQFCEMFNVAREELSDDEGGGSVSLEFPPDWTEDQATHFAYHFLDLDLGEHYGGPGRFFQNSYIGRKCPTGEVVISVRWGLDI